MRFIIPNVMSEQVAKTFVPEYLDWNDSRLKDVLDVVANNCDAYSTTTTLTTSTSSLLIRAAGESC